MKKLLIALLLVCSPVYASGFKLGSEVSHITYEEKNLSVGLPQAINVKESGTMYGVVASFTSAEKLYLKADSKFSWGQVNYSGSGTLNGIDDYMLEVRGLAGWIFRRTKLNIIPYTGFGYRYLKDDGSGKQTSDGSFSYLRESNYEYLPIGVLLEKEINKDWSANLNLEADALLNGNQVSRLDQIEVNGKTSLFPKLENKQSTGGGR